ncbi:mandelate racemase/muconate lactonizing enzyme family protein [Conexibacter stalactiti]|uniref:Mandelate racemase/muconate lactonizing enzyme family protein n=1 Tax=Conexibacter stalactiti TaxID=1940611 RepID=A0ABU4HU09_9ACTN|nr:mandelate racemase/muconate lactonizing enzyme family protein [Conexibacter stalactiti]MDW5596756.1 mandelate racemase/muconate lactonizing enzyme family protein [Conexibacter stalactiti]MEC5037398.1 mandelate racemase/muconate lactonizing enzyme family protein [Conexibacter stalactiti]
MRLAIAPRRLRLRTPLPTAHGTITERELLDVIVMGADGVAGAGEAAPLPAYDGVALDDVHAALEDCRPILREAEGLPRAQILAECRQVAVLPQAIAAIDLALWDREGRRVRAPVASLLGAEAGMAIAVNALVGAADRAGAAAEATALVAAGHRVLKLKAGVGDDAGRLAAVRAAVGPDVALRLDANGAWETPREAVAQLRALSASGIELIEEPVHGVEALRDVQETLPGLPVAMDESGVGPGAIDAGATRLVCLKLSRCGGITGLIEAADRARAAGSEVYLASTFDGPLGIAGALHAAAAIAPAVACGLATLDAFDGLDVDPALAVRDGFMRVPTGPGLGIRA